MNKKYEKYINYIVNELEPPYFKNMRDQYGLSPDEYKLVLSKLYKQPVSIKGRNVFDEQGNNIYYVNDDQRNLIYYENSNGWWEKREYDNLRNIIYFENSNGWWEKREYDNLRNIIYFENSDGYWEKREYDNQGNIIYHENSHGEIDDRR
jgi:hypothetical protein